MGCLFCCEEDNTIYREVYDDDSCCDESCRDMTYSNTYQNQQYQYNVSNQNNSEIYPYYPPSPYYVYQPIYQSGYPSGYQPIYQPSSVTYTQYTQSN